MSAKDTDTVETVTVDEQVEAKTSKLQKFVSGTKAALVGPFKISLLVVLVFLTITVSYNMGLSEKPTGNEVDTFVDQSVTVEKGDKFWSGKTLHKVVNIDDDDVTIKKYRWFKKPLTSSEDRIAFKKKVIQDNIKL